MSSFNPAPLTKDELRTILPLDPSLTSDRSLTLEVFSSDLGERGSILNAKLIPDPSMVRGTLLVSSLDRANFIGDDVIKSLPEDIRKKAKPQNDPRVGEGTIFDGPDDSSSDSGYVPGISVLGVNKSDERCTGKVVVDEEGISIGIIFQGPNILDATFMPSENWVYLLPITFAGEAYPENRGLNISQWPPR